MSNFKSIGQGVRGLRLPPPKSGVSHWLWMSLLQQCYALTCYTVKSNCISSNLLISLSCLNVCWLCVPNIMSLGACLKKINLVNVSACLYRQNWRYFSASGLKDEKLIKKQTYMKTETCKLYSRDFWIFLVFLPKSSKSISIILSYIVSKLVHFWDTV